MVAGSTPGSDTYRDAILGTAGRGELLAARRASGSTASDEASATTGTLQGRYVLGQPGVLGPLGNTSTSFDGAAAS